MAPQKKIHKVRDRERERKRRKANVVKYEQLMNQAKKWVFPILFFQFFCSFDFFQLKKLEEKHVGSGSKTEITVPVP